MIFLKGYQRTDDLVMMIIYIWFVSVEMTTTLETAFLQIWLLSQLIYLTNLT